MNSLQACLASLRKARENNHNLIVIETSSLAELLLGDQLGDRKLSLLGGATLLVWQYYEKEREGKRHNLPYSEVYDVMNLDHSIYSYQETCAIKAGKTSYAILLGCRAIASFASGGTSKNRKWKIIQCLADSNIFYFSNKIGLNEFLKDVF